MKRVHILLFLLLAAPLVRGQTPIPAAGPSRAEIEENYKVLEGRIKDALEGKAAQDKLLQSLAKQVEDLRAQMSKPTGNYATKDDLKDLVEKIQEIDKKRQEDKELILKEIKDLGKKLAVVPVAPRPGRTNSPAAAATPPSTGEKADEGYWYTIKPNDTFKKIAQYYRDQGINVTSDQIAKANPTVQDTKLIVDKKLFVPAPKGP